jgi:uncharacterized protein
LGKKTKNSLVILTLAGALLAGATQTALAACTVNKVDLRWQGGSARFEVEVVDTIETRAKGLMFRESLPKFAGMLFVFDAPQNVSFWMKNTLIPLDMLFFDQRGVAKRVFSNATPGSLTPIPGGADIIAVLEINGGLANQLGVPEGAEIQHPSFDQEQAAWPCEKTN